MTTASYGAVPASTGQQSAALLPKSTWAEIRAWYQGVGPRGREGFFFWVSLFWYAREQNAFCCLLEET